MKLRILLPLSVFLCILTAPSLYAQNRPGNTEVGIIVGEPTGLSAKFWVTQNSAFDLGLAWSFSGQGSMHIHSNYLIHNPLDNPDLSLYYGFGGRLLLQNDPAIGARIPLGLQYNIPESRLSVFFELSPMLDLVPSTQFDVNGGLGLRYFL